MLAKGDSDGPVSDREGTQVQVGVEKLGLRVCRMLLASTNRNRWMRQLYVFEISFLNFMMVNAWLLHCCNVLSPAAY
jgi:hypothetical protein